MVLTFSPNRTITNHFFNNNKKLEKKINNEKLEKILKSLTFRVKGDEWGVEIKKKIHQPNNKN